MDKVNQLLEAKKTVHFQYKGQRGDEYQVEDFTTQLKAAVEIWNFLGVYAPKSAPIRQTEGITEDDVPSPDERFDWSKSVPESVSSENQPDVAGGDLDKLTTNDTEVGC